MNIRSIGPAAFAAAGLLLAAACSSTPTPPPDPAPDVASEAAAGYPESASSDDPSGYPDPAAGYPAGSHPMDQSAYPGPDTERGRSMGATKRALFPHIAHGDPAGGSTEEVATAPEPVDEAVPPPADPGVAGACAGIVQRDGEGLALDGRPVVFFGVNAPFLIDESFPESQVEPTLRDLSERDVNTVRVWFFHDEDPDRLERLLNLGNQYGIRFVVTLEDNVFKGRDWFFGDDDEKNYRPHLEATVTRFRDRPEILAWEVMNEPNCGERFDDDCLKTIKDWLTMSTRMVKAIDACHVVTTGVIGAGNYQNEWDNYRRVHRGPTVDLASSHRRSTEDRDKDLELAARIERPIFYGEIYDKGYDDGCQPLDGGAELHARAERVKDDLRDAIEDGVDGYLLWDYAAGGVERDDGKRMEICGEFGYERDDPLWAKLSGEESLPPSVPWR